MSFILDALKKSERERQRATVPGISDLPVVVHESRTSIWLVTTVALLFCGVAVLGWAWWRSSPPGVSGTAVAPPTEAVSAPIPAPISAVVPASTTNPPETRSLANEATRVASARPAADASAATSTRGATGAPRPSSVNDGSRSYITDAPMSIVAARAAGMPVPELTLELLVFGDDPRQRFVYINATKYVEGETLAAGPRLVEITPEGAILSYNGREFLLPQN